jgi:hypothetical protein
VLQSGVLPDPILLNLEISVVRTLCGPSGFEVIGQFLAPSLKSFSTGSILPGSHDEAGRQRSLGVLLGTVSTRCLRVAHLDLHIISDHTPRFLSDVIPGFSQVCTMTIEMTVIKSPHGECDDDRPERCYATNLMATFKWITRQCNIPEIASVLSRSGEQSCDIGQGQPVPVAALDSVHAIVFDQHRRLRCSTPRGTSHQM